MNHAEVVGHMATARLIAQSIACHHRGQWFEQDDLIGAAMFGLVQAGIRFDKSRGHFPAFANRRIAGAVKDEMRKAAPGGKSGGINQQLDVWAITIDRLHDFTAVEYQDHEAREVQELGAAAIRALSGRLLAVIRMRFYEDLGHSEIARRLGISVPRVCQLQYEAYTRMRVQLKLRHGITRMREII